MQPFQGEQNTQSAPIALSGARTEALADRLPEMGKGLQVHPAVCEIRRFQYSAHAVYDIKHHFIWITKYRYKILRGPVAERARDLIRQICQAVGVVIVRGAVSPNHIHMLVSAPTELSPAKLAQYIKGRSSRRLQQEFPELSKRYWVLERRDPRKIQIPTVCVRSLSKTAYAAFILSERKLISISLSQCSFALTSVCMIWWMTFSVRPSLSLPK